MIAGGQYTKLGDGPPQDEQGPEVPEGPGKQASEEKPELNGKRIRVAKMDSPHWYLVKCIFVYSLVVLDILLNCIVNSDEFGYEDMATFWPFLFLVVQTSLQLFIFLTLFLLMCSTHLMQIGLIGVVLSNFKALGLTQALYLVMTLILGILRVVHAAQNKDTEESPSLWHMPGFEVIFIVQNLCAGLYYHQVLYSTFRLADEKYYDVTKATFT